VDSSWSVILGEMAEGKDTHTEENRKAPDGWRYWRRRPPRRQTRWWVLWAAGMVGSLVIIGVLVLQLYPSTWQHVSEHPLGILRGRVPILIGMGLALAGFIVLLAIGGASLGWTGFANRTVWDWMQLLVVPVALAGIGFWFAIQQDARQNDIEDRRAQAERDLAEQRADDDALQAYLDQIGTLLLERNLRSSIEDNATEESQEARSLARARTLTVLRRLDSSRKSEIMQFLLESDLVNRGGNIVYGGASSTWLQGSESKPVIDLDRADLVGIHLSEPDLAGAGLNEADLSDAYLWAAVLVRAELTEADLGGAKLRYAQLSSAELGEAVLRHADLSKADLGGANLFNAHLSGTDLIGASLIDANLNHANLDHADLSKAELQQADLTYTDLRHADLSEAYLSDDLYGPADLDHADLDHADLSDTSLSHVDLRHADLSGADLGCGFKTNRVGLSIKSCTDLYHADLSNADLRRADLSNAEGVTAEQLEQADHLEGATMPNGQKYEDWLKDKEGAGEDE
jgi:uncharacterized protein YjbI with pentapeptide repeats